MKLQRPIAIKTSRVAIKIFRCHETDESKTTDDKNGEEKIVSKNEIAKTNSNKDEPSSNKGSSGGHETDQTKTTDDKNGEEKIVSKNEIAKTNSNKDEPSSNKGSSGVMKLMN
ncbi:hypothetical protein TNCT_630071 [Trichonephila clavata]|uniref:Uncharacterized protein n=1 Tax=Trichonephila clavata TaxID=2740835 RepID=A0A8X6KYB2_TRICU|nr:hypothetical protein TNCT_630071 [Trichonephila clavata]